MSAAAPIFCVFSFNRGRFLEHCVRSIQAGVPNARIMIFDDHSNDEDTCAVLARLSADCEVITPDHDADLSFKCGGLYANMQLALTRLPANSLALCIQDDMQLVRPLQADDISAIHGFFQADPQAAFLQPAFMRDRHRQRDQRITAFDATVGAYLREDSGQSAGVFFSAVSILHVDRLRAAGWVFAPTEKQNEAQARQQGFSRMGLMRDPLVFYLPSVPAYRGKKKTWALAWAEKHRRCGFYPYRTMSGEEVTALRQRPSAQLPVAEDWLRTESGEPKPPWIFYPIEGSAWLKALNKLELRLRALWQRWFG